MNQPTDWYYSWVYMIRNEGTVVYLGTGYAILPAQPTENNLKAISDTVAASLKNELDDIPGRLILTITGAIPVYGPEHDTRIDLVQAKVNLADQFFSGLR